MKRIIGICVVGVLVACTDRSPIGPDGPSPIDPNGPRGQNCGLGPVAVVSTPGQPCSVRPQCPRVRPAGAETLFVVSTCGFGANATSCTPIQNPGCPSTQRVATHFLLANPDRPGSICTADVNLVIEPTAAGGARFLWDAQEFENAPSGGCRSVGAEYEGEGSVEGPCCERAIDIPLPHARRTFRIVIRTDWQ